jgi:Ino eighty subunit 1
MAPSSSSAAQATRTEDPDPRNSLKHVLMNEPDATDSQDGPSQAKSTEPSASQPEDPGTPTADDGAEPSTKPDGDAPMYTATTTTTRRNANGSVSSVYSGNKIRHLKKDDGIPLWRKDIQYDFLKMVFEDDKKVFHKMSDGTSGNSFADIYLDAMAKSSKCSKILKDKLLTERAAAVNMAMVCLLVNVGRMNTTLNCKLFWHSACDRPVTDLFQSSRRCGLSSGRTIPSRRCKPTKTPTHTNSCKTLLD